MIRGNLTGTGITVPATAIATIVEMMKTMMEYLAKQDAKNKSTNERISAITAVMTLSSADDTDLETTRRQFRTDNSTN